MESLYQGIVELLGKEQIDPLFLRLVNEFGENPEIVHQDERGTEYLLRKLGVGLSFSECSKCFVSIFFHCSSEGVRSGTVARYEGDLPVGIMFGDSRADVERKLRLKPVSSRRVQGAIANAPSDVWDEYNQAPLVLCFIFKGSADKLGSVVVHYRPTEGDKFE